MTIDNNIIEHKVCSHCSISKPRTDYYKAKCCKDGLRGECKACVASKQKTYNKDNAAVIARQKKTAYDANPKKNRDRSRRYYLANQDRLKQKSLTYHNNNRDYVLKRKRAYHHKNKEIINHKKRLYRLHNTSHVDMVHKQWCLKNKQRRNEMRRRYKHQRRSALGTLSVGIADRLYSLQQGRCVCCGEALNDEYHIDHIIPIALGGTNTDDNVQLLKPSCNRSKSAKHPVDYMQEKGFLL